MKYIGNSSRRSILASPGRVPRPLRRKLLVRLMLDQIAWKLPFKLYSRIHLGRWLAPTLKEGGTSPGAPLIDQT